MKVKELISELQKLNPELEVVFKPKTRNPMVEDFYSIEKSDINLITGKKLSVTIQGKNLYDCSLSNGELKSKAEKLVSLSGPTMASKMRNE